MVEYVPFTTEGRRFSQQSRVRLGDTGGNGIIRPDAIARILQNVATDDWDELNIDRDLQWLVRRTSFRVVEGAQLPKYGEFITCTTWGSGHGAAWGERRTNIYVGDVLSVEAASIWVPVNFEGMPQRMRPGFINSYGEASSVRKVSGRIAVPEIPSDAKRTPWFIRRSDIDIVDHVNNAASWQAVSEVATAPVVSASLIHHGPVEKFDEVTLVSAPGLMCLEVDGAVQVSCEFQQL